MSGAQPWNHWYGLMNWAGLFWWPLSYDAFGYAIEDLNKDGTPELILLLRDYSVFAIFTTVDGEPILLGDYYTRHRCAILDSGLLYTWSSSGEDEWEFALQQISPDSRELLYIVQYGSTTGGELEQHEQHYYKIIEGTEMIISEMELAAFLEQNPLFGDTTPKEITKKSGIVFIPLFDS
ncbi:MAG: hypothetical protein FWF10_09350 [Clostridiales bacterium]|nr:hypothetical protein [Clostridiales bacterium]